MKQVDKLQSSKIKPPPKKKISATKRIVVKKKAPAKQATVLDSVFKVIKRTRKGIAIAKIQEKTGLNSKQISNALYKLSNKDMIVAKERGLYVKK